MAISVRPPSVEISNSSYANRLFTRENSYKAIWTITSLALTALSFNAPLALAVGSISIGLANAYLFGKKINELRPDQCQILQKWMIVSCLVFSSVILVLGIHTLPLAGWSYQALRELSVLEFMFKLFSFSFSFGFFLHAAIILSRFLYEKGNTLLGRKEWSAMQQWMEKDVKLDQGTILKNITTFFSIVFAEKASILFARITFALRRLPQPLHPALESFRKKCFSCIPFFLNFSSGTSLNQFSDIWRTLIEKNIDEYQAVASDLTDREAQDFLEPSLAMFPFLSSKDKIQIFPKIDLLPQGIKDSVKKEIYEESCFIENIEKEINEVNNEYEEYEKKLKSSFEERFKEIKIWLDKLEEIAVQLEALKNQNQSQEVLKQEKTLRDLLSKDLARLSPSFYELRLFIEGYLSKNLFYLSLATCCKNLSEPLKRVLSKIEELKQLHLLLHVGQSFENMKPDGTQTTLSMNDRLQKLNSKIKLQQSIHDEDAADYLLTKWAFSLNNKKTAAEITERIFGIFNITSTDVDRLDQLDKKYRDNGIEKMGDFITHVLDGDESLLDKRKDFLDEKGKTIPVIDYEPLLTRLGHYVNNTRYRVYSALNEPSAEKQTSLDRSSRMAIIASKIIYFVASMIMTIGSIAISPKPFLAGISISFICNIIPPLQRRTLQLLTFIGITEGRVPLAYLAASNRPLLRLLFTQAREANSFANSTFFHQIRLLSWEFACSCFLLFQRIEFSFTGIFWGPLFFPLLFPNRAGREGIPIAGFLQGLAIGKEASDLVTRGYHSLYSRIFSRPVVPAAT